MGVCAQGHAKGAGETEIGQLEVAVLVDQQVLGLQIAMENTVGVTVLDALAELHHELANNTVSHAQVHQVHRCALGKSLATTTVSDGKGLHVLLEVEVEELKDEVKLVAIGVNDVKETDDVGVFQFFEEGDFADGGAGDAFILGFESNLLQGNDAAMIAQVSGFIDNSIGACSLGKRYQYRRRVVQTLEHSGNEEPRLGQTHLHQSFPAFDSYPWLKWTGCGDEGWTIPQCTENQRRIVKAVVNPKESKEPESPVSSGMSSQLSSKSSEFNVGVKLTWDRSARGPRNKGGVARRGGQREKKRRVLERSRTMGSDGKSTTRGSSCDGDGWKYAKCDVLRSKLRDAVVTMMVTWARRGRKCLFVCVYSVYPDTDSPMDGPPFFVAPAGVMGLQYSSSHPQAQNLPANKVITALANRRSYLH